MNKSASEIGLDFVPKHHITKLNQEGYYKSYETEEVKKETKINHINYDSMHRTEIKHEGLDDISDILDEI